MSVEAMARAAWPPESAGEAEERDAVAGLPSAHHERGGLGLRGLGVRSRVVADVRSSAVALTQIGGDPCAVVDPRGYVWLHWH